jgi:hypothetical protein
LAIEAKSQLIATEKLFDAYLYARQSQGNSA